MQRNIVDIVGPAATGKSLLCQRLVELHGFTLYRPSDLIRTFAKQNGIPLLSRQDYIGCHIRLIEADPDAMIRPALDSSDQQVCLDGMRAPAPMQKLRELLGAYSIYLACPDEIRYQRVVDDMTRSGHRKPPSFEHFLEDEKPDEYNQNPALPSMRAMYDTADYVVDASQEFENVWAEVEGIVLGRS